MAGRPLKLACLGDSLTYSQGGPNSWPSLLAASLGPLGWTVDNLGQSGDTPFGMMQRYSLVAQNYGYVTIMGGANTVGLGADNCYHYLRRIYDMARSYGTQVFALTMTPAKGYTGWGASQVAEIQATNARISATAGSVVVNTYAPFGGAGANDPDALDPAIDSGDHLHYNATGWQRMHDLLRPVILANL